MTEGHGCTLAQKNGVTHFDDKNHIAVGRETKVIDHWEVSLVHVHDSQVFETVKVF